MHQVRLAGGAGLTFMMLQGVVVGFLDDGQVVLGTVVLNPLHELAEFCERKSGGRDLLAQARHAGLYPVGGVQGRKALKCSDWNILLKCSNWNILCMQWRTHQDICTTDHK